MRAGEMRSGALDRWIGRFPVRGALIIFFVFAVLGALATLATNNDPGSLLGNMIVVGAVIAALGIRRQRLYLLIPLPALTYLALAIVTGLIHDRDVDTSTTQLGLNFLQWIGNGFFSMAAATILVLLIFGARLLASRSLVSGSFPMSEQRTAAGRSGRATASAGASLDSPYRKSRAPWDDADPWYDNVPRDRDAWKDRSGRDGGEGWDDAGRSRRDGRDGRDTRDGASDRNGARDSGDRAVRERGRGSWGGDSQRSRRPERRPDDRRGDGWNGADRNGDDRNGDDRNGDDRTRDERRRPGSRDVPPDRGESATRVMPSERGPRPGAVPRSDAPGNAVPRSASGPRNGASRRGNVRSGDPRPRDPRSAWDDSDPRLPLTHGQGAGPYSFSRGA